MLAENIGHGLSCRLLDFGVGVHEGKTEFLG